MWASETPRDCEDCALWVVGKCEPPMMRVEPCMGYVPVGAVVVREERVQRHRGDSGGPCRHCGMPTRWSLAGGGRWTHLRSSEGGWQRWCKAKRTVAKSLPPGVVFIFGEERDDGAGENHENCEAVVVPISV